MNNKIEILKIINYDKFKCIADRCKFTCCEGWKISVDDNTYDRFVNGGEKTKYILDNIKIEKYDNKNYYSIDKEINKTCPLLDKKGLCEIVKNNGEEYLSRTCSMFPRIENVFDDRRELSLSCACPEVVDLIENTSERINIISEDNIYLENKNLELKLRDIIINIISEEGFLLENKLIIAFEMLMNILNNENQKEDDLLEDIEKYKNKNYIQRLVNSYKKVKFNTEESVEELNNLFLDIIENYKDVSGLKGLLREIYDLGESVEVNTLSSNWSSYKLLFEKYEKLIENCIIAKVISNCVSSNIEDMIVAFQMIILEYLLVRYAVFLKYLMTKEIKIDDIKDYIVAFSRIIGNNTEAVIEFFEEDFEDSIFETGYLCFITLF